MKLTAILSRHAQSGTPRPSRWIRSWALGVCALALTSAQGFADEPIPTPNWTDFYGAVSFNGGAAPEGSLVEAFDPQGVLCGKFVVLSAGLYGFMPVYGDDDRTAGVDEGAITDDPIAFKVNGLDADQLGPASSSWGPPPASQREMALSVAGGVTGLLVVSLPGDQFAAPFDTVEFQIVFQNTGNVTDFYKWSISTPNNWEVLASSDWIYVPAGGGDHMETFKVIVPGEVAGEVHETVTFSFTSGLNAANAVAGSADVIVLVTDVGDDDDPTLPAEFALGQNYPNPFNPATKIPFTLSQRSPVTLTVYSIDGRTVSEMALGTLPAGSHEVDFQGDGLASGVYLYKLRAGSTSAVKRMILLK